MKFDGIEHYDHFEDETVFWGEMSGLPQDIQDWAKAIDGEAYNPNCFGLCVFHSQTTKEWAIMTETDLSTGESLNIFYVDNDGNKHWRKAELPEEITQQVFEACGRINDGRDTLHGYEIKDAVLFENGRGVAFAENPKAPEAFVTWMFTQDKYGRRDYERGNYFKDGERAAKDFKTRTDNYRRDHHVQEARRPIAQQMKEAAKLADADRGRPAPRKDKSGRDGR